MNKREIDDFRNSGKLKEYMAIVENQKQYDKRIQEINETKKRISQLEKLIKVEKRKLRELNKEA